LISEDILEKAVHVNKNECAEQMQVNLIMATGACVHLQPDHCNPKAESSVRSPLFCKAMFDNAQLRTSVAKASLGNWGETSNRFRSSGQWWGWLSQSGGIEHEFNHMCADPKAQPTWMTLIKIGGLQGYERANLGGPAQHVLNGLIGKVP